PGRMRPTRRCRPSTPASPSSRPRSTRPEERQAMQVDRKILGSGIAGVLALLVWGISAAFGHPIPAETVLPVSIPLVVGVGYLLTPAQRDIENRINDAIAKAAGYMPDPSPSATAIRNQ